MFIPSLAGVAVFERQIDRLIQNADRCAAGFDPNAASDEIEFHNSVMASGGSHPCKGMARKDRLAAIEESLGLSANAHRSLAAFAVAVDKQVVSPRHPVEYEFEEICSRFDLFLSRIWKRQNERYKDSSSWTSRTTTTPCKDWLGNSGSMELVGGTSAILPKSRCR